MARIRHRFGPQRQRPSGALTLVGVVLGAATFGFTAAGVWYQFCLAQGEPETAAAFADLAPSPAVILLASLGLIVMVGIQAETLVERAHADESPRPPAASRPRGLRDGKKTPLFEKAPAAVSAFMMKAVSALGESPGQRPHPCFGLPGSGQSRPVRPDGRPGGLRALLRRRVGMDKSRSILVLAAAVILTAAAAAPAQQCDWLPGEGMPGLDDYVTAATVYDDGTGPALYVGGAFTFAGDVPAACIAKWNGTSWAPLGSGMGGGDYPYPCVYALTVFNGELIGGGGFTTAGGNPASNIARWNGSAWQPLGSGMNGEVDALTVYNGQLIAGGQFTTADGVTANRIAK